MDQLIRTGLACLVSVASGYAQPAAAPTPQNKPIPNEIKMIAGDVTLIEETTLIPFAGYGSYRQPNEILPSDLGGGSTMKYYSAASGDTIRDAYEEQVTSMRCYGFQLVPGETLMVRLKVNSSSRMVMRFVPRPVADMMTSQVLRANQPPRPVRSRLIQIKNITDESYQVNLALSGFPNHPFKLEIQRNKD
jgi:hypothetical protein